MITPMAVAKGFFNDFIYNKPVLGTAAFGAAAMLATKFSSIGNFLTSSEIPQLSAAAVVTYLPTASLVGVGVAGSYLLYKGALAACNAYIGWRDADSQRAKAAAAAAQAAAAQEVTEATTPPFPDCHGLSSFNAEKIGLLQRLYSLEKEKKSTEETKQNDSLTTTQSNLDVQIKNIKDGLHALRPAEKLRLLRLISDSGEKHSELKKELEAYFTSLKPALLNQTVTDLKGQIEAHYGILGNLLANGTDTFLVRSQLMDLDFEKDLLKKLTSQDVQPVNLLPPVDFSNLPAMDGFSTKASLHKDLLSTATASGVCFQSIIEKNGNSLLVATLQTLFSQPSVIQAIPKAIQNQLIETKLFEGDGIKDVLAKNPDLSYTQQTALKKIGELLRKGELTKDDLKELSREMRLLAQNAFPKGIHQDKYNQILTLLILHDFYVQSQLGSVAGAEIQLIYQALKNIAPNDFPSNQEMKEIDPEKILGVLTDLMGLHIAFLDAKEKPDYRVTGGIPDLVIYRQTQQKGVLMPGRVTVKTDQTETTYDTKAYLMKRGEQAAAYSKTPPAAGKHDEWHYLDNNLAGPNQLQRRSPGKDAVEQYGYLVIASKVEKTKFFGWLS